MSFISLHNLRISGSFSFIDPTATLILSDRFEARRGIRIVAKNIVIKPNARIKAKRMVLSCSNVLVSFGDLDTLKVKVSAKEAYLRESIAPCIQGSYQKISGEDEPRAATAYAQLMAQHQTRRPRCYTNRNK